jgi:16S rRNA processing protein RimM
LRLEVGRIGRAHGLDGEVTVVPITNREERFAPGSSLYVDDRVLVVVSSRRHQDRWLVRFAGVEDRNGADELRGRVLMADALADTGEDELWVHELIGSEVRDCGGTPLGVVTAVEANPAHDQLVLDGGALVPVVFVVTRAPGVIVVDVPEGLLDL